MSDLRILRAVELCSYRAHHRWTNINQNIAFGVSRGKPIIYGLVLELRSLLGYN